MQGCAGGGAAAGGCGWVVVGAGGWWVVGWVACDRQALSGGRVAVLGRELIDEGDGLTRCLGALQRDGHEVRARARVRARVRVRG